MKKLTHIMNVCTVLAGLMASSCVTRQAAAPQHPKPHQAVAPPTPTPKIIKQPKSRIAQKGTHVDFTVLAKNVMSTNGLNYQWLFNGTTIQGATNKTYCIEDVQVTDVGSYSAIVMGFGSNVTQSANLIVYYMHCGNSVAGTIVAGIGAFSTGSIVCDGTTFDRVSSNYFNFYGPNASPQTGNFQNTTYMPKLTLDTYTNINNLVDTGVRIQKNFGTYGTVSCNNNGSGAPPSQPLLSKCGPILLSTKTGTSENRYRVTVFYKNSTIGANTTITLNFRYHDDP